MKYGNLVVVGHNYKSGKFFGKLKKLTKGDNIFVTSIDGNVRMYKVYDKYIIDATDMRCTNQETNGQIELTLITCADDNTKRLVLKCRAVAS